MNRTPPGVSDVQIASSIANARAQNIGSTLMLTPTMGLGNTWASLLALQGREMPSAEEVCTLYVSATRADGSAPMETLRGRVTWGSGGSRGGSLLFDLTAAAALAVPTGAITVEVSRYPEIEERTQAIVSGFLARGNHGGELFASLTFEDASDLRIPTGAVRVFTWSDDGSAITFEFRDFAGALIATQTNASGAGARSQIPPHARYVRVISGNSGTLSFRLLQ